MWRLQHDMMAASLEHIWKGLSGFDDVGVGLKKRYPCVELSRTKLAPDDVIRQGEDMCRVQGRGFGRQNGGTTQTWNNLIWIK